MYESIISTIRCMNCGKKLHVESEIKRDSATYELPETVREFAENLRIIQGIGELELRLANAPVDQNCPPPKNYALIAFMP